MCIIMQIRSKSNSSTKIQTIPKQRTHYIHGKLSHGFLAVTCSLQNRVFNNGEDSLNQGYYSTHLTVSLVELTLNLLEFQKVLSN